MITYITIFILLSLVAITNYNDKKFFYFFTFFLAVFCAIRGVGVDRDYETYVSIYNYIIDGYTYAIEPTFYLLSKLSYYVFDSPWMIFIAYAALAVYFKVKIINYWSPYILLSVVINFSNIFLLHEMTQIRIGLASSIGFYSLKFLVNNEKRKYYIWVVVATLFHFSMALFLLLPLLNLKTLSFRYSFFYCIAIFWLYVLHLLDINLSGLINHIGIDFIQAKYHMYQNQVIEEGIKVNVFSVIQVLHVLITFFAMYYSSYFKEDKKLIMMIKIFSLGPLSLIAFSAVPGFSLRLSELFSVGEIVLLPMLVKQVKQVRMAYIAVIFLSLSIFLINLYYLSLVKEYAI